MIQIAPPPDDALPACSPREVVPATPMYRAGTRIVAQNIQVPNPRSHASEPRTYTTVTIVGRIMPRNTVLVGWDNKKPIIEPCAPRPTRDQLGRYMVQPETAHGRKIGGPILIHHDDMEVV